MFRQPKSQGLTLTHKLFSLSKPLLWTNYLHSLRVFGDKVKPDKEGGTEALATVWTKIGEFPLVHFLDVQPQDSGILED